MRDFFGGGSSRRSEGQTDGTFGLVHRHTLRGALPHLFPLTGEERDGSLQDMPKGEGQVRCWWMCGGGAVVGRYKICISTQRICTNAFVSAPAGSFP